jgi:acetylornithine deacetylase/succinyl-diaminopimelate desuccinylase-like protein
MDTPLTLIRDRLAAAIDRERLIRTAVQLIEIPSPTGHAAAAADALEHLLRSEGFDVARVEADHPAAPAVVARCDSTRAGPTLQLEAHLDTVHLPFVPPRIEAGQLRGSGAADMKAGLAAAVETLRVLRECGDLLAGSIILTAHDLHEAPWGDGRQLDHLARSGHVGDCALIPEPLSDRLPIAGRGSAIWNVAFHRPGEPLHEVLRNPDLPSVIFAGAYLVARLQELETRLARQVHPVAGRSSVFVGQFHAGEIYNQDSNRCQLEGTRRWIPGSDRKAVERELRALVEMVSNATGVPAECRFLPVRDAFQLDLNHPFVASFQTAHAAVLGAPLPPGDKPFVDDGNTLWSLARIPAITHGPRSGGQHTLHEWVDLDDLPRLVLVYALTAVLASQLDRTDRPS